NSEGMVIMYADKITDSMRYALDETARRRETQMAFNEEHGITPTTITKEIRDYISAEVEIKEDAHKEDVKQSRKMTKKEREKTIEQLEKDMKQAAKDLDFETASELRDALFELKAEGLFNREKYSYQRQRCETAQPERHKCGYPEG